jgi:hypothetical protein
MKHRIAIAQKYITAKYPLRNIGISEAIPELGIIQNCCKKGKSEKSKQI